MIKQDVQENSGFPICVLTTTRADYGILRPLLLRLQEDRMFHLRVAVTGTHLSQTFGMTVREIEEDNLPIGRKQHTQNDVTGDSQSIGRIQRLF